MNYTKIITRLQESLLLSEQALAELRCMNEADAVDCYITRQEAADLMGKSLRQMDRDCRRYGIRRKHCNNGVRISKRDVLVHIGALSENGIVTEKMSDLDRLHYRLHTR